MNACAARSVGAGGEPNDVSSMKQPESFSKAFDFAHEVVIERTGFSDFGPDDYRWGLTALLRSMDYDPHFSPAGRVYAWGEVVTALSARAIAFEHMKRHPDAADVAIREPIVIVGIPRTGTTARHQLMAVDPQFQGLPPWLTTAPMPRPPRDEWAQNTHFRETVASLEAMFERNPAMRVAHNIVADEVDECNEIMRQGFVSNRLACAWSAASYDAWWQTQSERPGYEHLARVLRLVGKDEPATRWLLKNPGHILALDLLFAIFPDAWVIQTHRNPAKAVPSLCALLVNAHRTVEVGRVEGRAINMGPREVEKWAKAIRECEPVRRAHADRVIDVVHGDFHRDPMSVIDRIYSTIGLRLAADVEAEMATRCRERPEMAHGVHAYEAVEFGINEHEILERFGNYPDQFGLRLGMR